MGFKYSVIIKVLVESSRSEDITTKETYRNKRLKHSSVDGLQTETIRTHRRGRN